MLDNKAANIGTVLNSMSKCKATAVILQEAYKQITAIREGTKIENHQYLGKPFFYGLTIGQIKSEEPLFCVRLESKGKVISIKL